MAWDRLIFLQYAILQLNISLSCSLLYEEKADSIKLKKLMLSDNEWELLDELCNILAPFEKATRDLSGGTYITLSQMFPIIINLANSLRPLNDSSEENEELSDNETIISDLEENIDNLNNQQDKVDYNITEVLESVKKSIYMGLKHYWTIPDEFGMMAALLDPRYKNLDFISDDEIKRKLHFTLQAQYDELKWEMQQQSAPPSPSSTTASNISDITSSTPNTRSLREHQARREQKTKEVFRTAEKTTFTTDEIATYLLMPIARENKNPLNWWRAKQEIFPILSIIAKKYLGVPATSVASERLFSDAGNHITAKRNSLDPSLLGKMVFLKRNMQTMDYFNVFPLDLNEEKGDFIESDEEI